MPFTSPSASSFIPAFVGKKQIFQSAFSPFFIPRGLNRAGALIGNGPGVRLVLIQQFRRDLRPRWLPINAAQVLDDSAPRSGDYGPGSSLANNLNRPANCSRVAEPR